MTNAREIDGFCTDCGNWTDLLGPIGDRRCRCGSGRVAVPPAGYRILGPDDVDPVTLERAAEAAYEAITDGEHAEEVAAAVRALGGKA